MAQEKKVVMVWVLHSVHFICIVAIDFFLLFHTVGFIQGRCLSKFCSTVRLHLITFPILFHPQGSMRLQ
jgi:hypothetical protein